MIVARRHNPTAILVVTQIRFISAKRTDLPSVQLKIGIQTVVNLTRYNPDLAHIEPIHLLTPLARRADPELLVIDSSQADPEPPAQTEPT